MSRSPRATERYETTATGQPPGRDVPELPKARRAPRRLGPSRKSGPARRRPRTRNPVTRVVRWTVGHPWSIIAAAGAVWLVVWAIGTRSEPHHVKVAFPTAFNLVPGQDVSVDGLDAGKISKVGSADGRAIVELGINDRYWPLPQGTTATSRYGTTIGSGTRRVDLVLGPDPRKTIPEDGIISSKDSRSAIDIDAVLNTASAATRQDATSLNKHVETALKGTAGETNSGIAATASGLQDIDGFLKDLGSDSVALGGLLTNADRFSTVLASRAGQVSDLVTVSARTFEAFADRSTELERTLDAVQPAADRAVTTLGKADSSIGGLTQLIDDIRPGATRLRPLAVAALPALQNLSDVVPTALSTVRTATRVAPELNTLLTNGTPFLAKAERVTKELQPMLHCIRPYTPDLASALQQLGSWGGTQELMDPNVGEGTALDQPFPFQGRKEGGKYRQNQLRARVTVSQSTVHAWPETPFSSENFAKLGKRYAYPRPPGLLGNKPQFMPECGITKDALDPSKDPETEVTK